jgi:putative endonuclease
MTPSPATGEKIVSTDAGRKAEAAAKVYLEMRGYSIIEQNFRRPRHEIDIVAKKADVIYFVEVKYRPADEPTGSVEAVTASKLRQLQRAAAIWIEEYKYPGTFQLAAVEVAGPEFTIMNFVDNAF